MCGYINIFIRSKNVSLAAVHSSHRTTPLNQRRRGSPRDRDRPTNRSPNRLENRPRSKRRRRIKDRRANDYSSSSDNRDSNVRKNVNAHAGAAAGILASLAQYLPAQNFGTQGFPFMNPGRQVMPTMFPQGNNVQPAQIQQAAAALAAMRLRSGAGFPFYLPQLFQGAPAMQQPSLISNPL